MYKEITLKTPDGEKRTVPMLANAATPIRYKMVFGKDLLNSMMFTGGTDLDIEIIGRLAYLLNKQAIKADLAKLTEDDYIDWLEGFDSMAFIDSAQEIVGVYLGSRGNSSKAKKTVARQPEK